MLFGSVKCIYFWSNVLEFHTNKAKVLNMFALDGTVHMAVRKTTVSGSNMFYDQLSTNGFVFRHHPHISVAVGTGLKQVHKSARCDLLSF